MIYSKEVENMCTVAKGPNHGPAQDEYYDDIWSQIFGW